MGRTQWVQDVTARRILLGSLKTEEDTMSDTVTSVKNHDTQSVVDQAETGKLLLREPRSHLGAHLIGRLRQMAAGSARSGR